MSCNEFSTSAFRIPQRFCRRARRLAICFAYVLLAFSACASPDLNAEVCRGSSLFGRPSEQTGLSDTQCSPTCNDRHGNRFEATTSGPSLAQAARDFLLKNPPPLLSGDPYMGELSSQEELSFRSIDWIYCGVRFWDDGSYSLLNVDPQDPRIGDSVFLTHRNPCGQCSSLEDLAVYLDTPNLTDPVRRCGLASLQEGDSAAIECLEEIGFSKACAQIWFFNTRHTRDQCFDTCIEHLSSDFNEADGSLNPCLQCDEDKSGPVFKRFSGRTRRNSGIPTSICRPAQGVATIDHAYLLEQ